MVFKIDNPYNPGEYGITDDLLNIIFVALYAHINTEFLVIIEEGFYNPTQIAKELTNKFNEAVTVYLTKYITENAPNLLDAFVLGGEYNQFVVAFNAVTMKLCFGNKSSGFTLSNDSQVYTVNNLKRNIVNGCFSGFVLPSFANWGLPAYLGFNRCPVSGTTQNSRFYYGDALSSGDNGYWLLPDLPSATAYSLVAIDKINIMGYDHFYMEIAGLNSMDETIPFAVSKNTTHSTDSTGVVNAAFARMPLSATPISQIFDYATLNIKKVFIPPAERIRRINVKIRYHNGLLVDFGKFDYSFTLQFGLFRPMSSVKTTNFEPSF